MKKSVVIFIIVIIVAFFCSVSHGADRYQYVGRTLGKDDYYIDTQSIAYTNNRDIIRFWARVVVSEQSIRINIAEEKDEEFKRILQKLSEQKLFLEINFRQNTYRIVENISFDRYGRVLYSTKKSGNWGNISPDSMIEAVRDTVYRIIQSNTYETPRQPFVTPQPQQRVPQQRVPQPQLPLNNKQQREEYSKLLEYVSWLIVQPDYPEFDRWVARKMVQAGVTPTQVNAGIEEYVRLSGGKYSDIRAMLASWYREFYMDKYGKH